VASPLHNTTSLIYTGTAVSTSVFVFTVLLQLLDLPARHNRQHQSGMAQSDIWTPLPDVDFWISLIVGDIRPETDLSLCKAPHNHGRYPGPPEWSDVIGQYLAPVYQLCVVLQSLLANVVSCCIVSVDLTGSKLEHWRHCQQQLMLGQLLLCLETPCIIPLPPAQPLGHDYRLP
jgi:hypothetical protein